MSDELTERDVEALAKVIRSCRMTPYGDGEGGTLWRHASAVEQARAILASDWYAERIAEALRETGITLTRDHAIPPGRDRRGYGYRMGWWDAINHAGGFLRRAALRGDA